MPEYSTTTWERAMKVQEVILQAMAKELTVLVQPEMESRRFG